MGQPLPDNIVKLAMTASKSLEHGIASTRLAKTVSHLHKENEDLKAQLKVATGRMKPKPSSSRSSGGAGGGGAQDEKLGQTFYESVVSSLGEEI